MCDVCKEEKIDFKFRNGNRPLHNCRLYRVYKSQVATVKLCHLHAIELFCIGENRFLENHPKLAVSLHRSTSVSNDVFSFS